MPNVIIHHFTVSFETQHNSNHHLELLFKTYMVSPTVEIMETECNWLSFCVGRCENSPDLFAKLKGRRRLGKGMGETWVDQQQETGKG